MRFCWQPTSHAVVDSRPPRSIPIKRFFANLITLSCLLSLSCAEKAGGPCLAACEAAKERESRCNVDSGSCADQCTALENTYQADVCEDESSALFDCMSAMNYAEISCETEALEAAIEIECEPEAETARICATEAVAD